MEAIKAQPVITEAIEMQARIFLARMAEEGFFTGPPGHKSHDPYPYDINCGYCEDFADVIEAEVSGAKAFWIEELDPKLDPHGGLHCVIRYKGRFYDAECPEGVDRLKDLPIFKNEGKTREQVIAEYKRAH